VFNVRERIALIIHTRQSASGCRTIRRASESGRASSRISRQGKSAGGLSPSLARENRSSDPDHTPAASHVEMPLGIIGEYNAALAFRRFLEVHRELHDEKIPPPSAPAPRAARYERLWSRRAGNSLITRVCARIENTHPALCDIRISAARTRVLF